MFMTCYVQLGLIYSDKSDDGVRLTLKLLFRVCQDSYRLDATVRYTVIDHNNLEEYVLMSAR